MIGELQPRAGPSRTSDFQLPDFHLRLRNHRGFDSHTYSNNHEYRASGQDPAHREATFDAVPGGKAAPPATTSTPHKPTLPYHEDNAKGEGESELHRM